MDNSNTQSGSSNKKHKNNYENEKKKKPFNKQNSKRAMFSKDESSSGYQMKGEDLRGPVSNQYSEAPNTARNEKKGNSLEGKHPSASYKKLPPQVQKSFNEPVIAGGKSFKKSLPPFASSPVFQENPFEKYRQIFLSILQHMSQKPQLDCSPLVHPHDSIFQTGSHSFYSQQITDILAHFNAQKHDIMEFLNIIVFDLSSLNTQILEKKITNVKEKVQSQKNDQIVSAATDEERPQFSNYEFLKTETMDPFFSQIIFDCFDYVLIHRRNYLKDLNSLQIQRICETILKTLQDQDQKIEEMYQIYKTNGIEVLDLDRSSLVAFRSIYDEIYRECCLRMIGQICYDNSPLVQDSVVEQIYKYVSNLAFMPDNVYQEQKAQKNNSQTQNINSFFYKTLRAAYNCIANILAQEESTFIQKNNPTILRKLRREFDYLISKIQTHYKSKRFISQMTTVLRALQFSMNLGTYQNVLGHSIKQAPGSSGGVQSAKAPEVTIPDNEVISLFISFYKLMFLGSRFAQKMLKIKVQSDAKLVIEPQTISDEEQSDTGFINDTSDQFSSDNQEASGVEGDLDPYQKIKIHANLAMRNLLKNNSKVLFNYWYIMFPSFMMRPQSEFSNFLFNFEKKNMQQEFRDKAFKFMETQEPTLFYIIRQSNNQSQLKSSVYTTLQTILESQVIQKQNFELEDYLAKSQKSVFQMTDVLGQFLRFMHYLLIISLHEGTSTAHLYPTNPKQQEQKIVPTVGYFDRQTYVQILKVIQTLIRITPYNLMKKGLSSIIMESLIENLQILDRVSNRDQLIRNEICSAINQVLNKQEVIPELREKFFDKYQKSDLCETLLNTMFKVQNFISNEKIQIIQTLGKNYPEVLTCEWLQKAKNNHMPKIQYFFKGSIMKIERKKVSQIIKIIEDWLKNYQFIDQADHNEERVLASEQKTIIDMIVEKKVSPYDNPIFSKFLFEVIDQNLLQQKLVQDNGFFNQRTQSYVSQPVLVLEINTSIAILNLICIMNQDQFQKIFTNPGKTIQLLDFISQIFIVQDQYPDNQIQVPSILKAAAIKTYGYLIQHEKGSSLFTENTYVCQTILGHCLNKKVLGDTNINVQIRNSWTISFICSLYPIEDIIRNGDQTLEILVSSCIKYAQYFASNKEKVAASSIRALGFIAQNLITLDMDQKKGKIAEILPTEELRAYVKEIVDVIITKLQTQKNSTPKVIWNLCVAISKIIDTYNNIYQVNSEEQYGTVDYTQSYLAKIFCFETTKCFLGIFMDGQNYKTKIHACQTLMKYSNLNQYGYLDKDKNPENLLRMFWIHIQDQLKYQINYNQVQSAGFNGQSGQEQIAYIEQIDKSFIEFWSHICRLTRKNLCSPCSQDQQGKMERISGHSTVMIDFFNNNAFDLMQSILRYLSRELKVPEYAAIFDMEDEAEAAYDFQKETEQLFESNPNLLSKLEQVKTNIIQKIFEIIDQEGSEVRVSMLVYSNFSTLSKCDVRTEYRNLEILRVKSSFNPQLN